MSYILIYINRPTFFIYFSDDPLDHKFDNHDLPFKADLSTQVSKDNEKFESASEHGSNKATQTPTSRRKTNSISATNKKFKTSSESLVSQAGSCVIEESVSSEAESSPGSGIVYKNIIISLSGNLTNEDLQCEFNLSDRTEKGREYIK